MMSGTYSGFNQLNPEEVEVDGSDSPVIEILDVDDSDEDIDRKNREQEEEIKFNIDRRRAKVMSIPQDVIEIVPDTVNETAVIQIVPDTVKETTDHPIEAVQGSTNQACQIEVSGNIDEEEEEEEDDLMFADEVEANRVAELVEADPALKDNF